MFGGAGLLDSLNDESDDDDYLPLSPANTAAAAAAAAAGGKSGAVTEIDFPVPRVPEGLSLLQDPSTIDFWTVDPLELARQWTLVDHALFAAIPPACLLFVTWTEPRHRLVATAIRRFIDRFNTASLWATASVLECQTAQERANRYSDLISLAAHLEALGNYNGLMAVLTGLQQACVTRLHDMLLLVDQDDKERLAGLQHTMAGNKNYANYRKALSAYDADAASGLKDKAGRPVVPHLGAHLAELTTIAEGNPEFLPDQPHLLNMTKKRLMARSVALLVSLQQRRYGLVPVRLVASILSRALEKHVHLTSLEANEAARQLFELSKYLEPPVQAAAGLLHSLSLGSGHSSQHHHHHHHHHHHGHPHHGPADRDRDPQSYEEATASGGAGGGGGGGIAEYALPESSDSSSDGSSDSSGSSDEGGGGGGARGGAASGDSRSSRGGRSGRSSKASKSSSKAGGSKAWERLKLLVGSPLGFRGGRSSGASGGSGGGGGGSIAGSKSGAGSVSSKGKSEAKPTDKSRPLSQGHGQAHAQAYAHAHAQVHAQAQAQAHGHGHGHGPGVPKGGRGPGAAAAAARSPPGPKR